MSEGKSNAAPVNRHATAPRMYCVCYCLCLCPPPKPDPIITNHQDALPPSTTAQPPTLRVMRQSNEKGAKISRLGYFRLC